MLSSDRRCNVDMLVRTLMFRFMFCFERSHCICPGHVDRRAEVETVGSSEGLSQGDQSSPGLGMSIVCRATHNAHAAHAVRQVVDSTCHDHTRCLFHFLVPGFCFLAYNKSWSVCVLFFSILICSFPVLLIAVIMDSCFWYVVFIISQLALIPGTHIR